MWEPGKECHQKAFRGSSLCPAKQSNCNQELILKGGRRGGQRDKGTPFPARLHLDGEATFSGRALALSHLLLVHFTSPGPGPGAAGTDSSL